MEQRSRIAWYTLLNLAKHGFWSLFGFFGLVYLTDVVRLDPKVAGLVLLASLVFDAVIDPPMGAAIEWVRSRRKDYQAIIGFGAVMCAAGILLFFHAHILGLGVAGLLGALLVFRCAFSIYDLSDNALASRITASPEERTLMSAWRKAAALSASMAIGASVGLVASNAEEAATRIPSLAVVVALAALALALIGYRALRTLDRAGPALEPIGLLERIRSLGRSKYALVLAAMALIEAAGTPILVGGFIYFSRASTGDANWAGAAVIAWSVAQLAALPIWIWIASRLGKRWTLALSHAATALACGVFAFCASASQFVGLILVAVIGVAISGVSTIRWSLAPDFIDDASRTGLRIETGIVGLISGAVQIGAGLATVALGVILAASGYQVDNPASLNPAVLAAALGGSVALAHVACAFIGLIFARRAG